MLDCKDYEKLIPDFLADKLDSETAENFIEHVETCQECMEEVSIQFLITEGMNRLEEGNTFELAKELGVLIEENKDWIYWMKCRKFVQYTSIFIGLCLLTALLLMVIII
ncbi:MAG: zf-HC2 domain-containing protein [Lachnospiraceae bacterium]|nr:zf-HC2 domain-containing protein [Lachnospiraceae bacterium]